MNSVYVIIASAIFLLLGYRYYGSKIASLWNIDPERKTPADTKYDGVDYVPCDNWFVLFGHHFASIAGAGSGGVVT